MKITSKKNISLERDYGAQIMQIILSTKIISLCQTKKRHSTHSIIM
uniref:Uncharacterized protein n=1 Tax=Rhizophora mucronata TaxID=61149 RepID=A0A2P2QY07_RHIMU